MPSGSGHCIVDSTNNIVIARFSKKYQNEDRCDELNREDEENNKPMTPLQQQIERINDCIASMESTIAVMKKEVKGLEEL